MPAELMVNFLMMLNVVASVVWDLSLATYEEDKQRWEGLRETHSPHEALHALANHYHGFLNVNDPRHAPAISALGQVFQLTGAMSAAYVPDGAPIDKTRMH